jgi:hypothetical protein
MEVVMRGQVRFGVAVVAAVILLMSTGATTASAQAPSCPRLAEFNPANFSNPTKIDNTYLPLIPGSQIVLEGRANRGGGPLPHRVTFTVTDLTKVINGVRTVVVWDVDVNEGQLAETELAFWAQDDAKNVWNLGEYPEEYGNGTFLGAPSTWIAGLSGAEGGVHMAGDPFASRARSFYLQGSAPNVDFLDCARVNSTGRNECVAPDRCYTDVLRTEETSPLDPQGGSQRKYHAPGVGIVKVDAVNDPEGEILVEVARATLDSEAMRAVRFQALALEARAYQINEDYARTERALGPPEPPPPPPPPSPPSPPPPPPPPPPNEVRPLTASAARSAVRAALRQRLRRWTISRVTCRLSRTRATCSFTARRRGFRVRGSGTVSRPAAGRRALRYRLTARITRNGCRPVSSRRCTRRTTWSR